MHDRLAIKHLSGSRAPELDRPALSPEREIIFGRDRDCHVRYDEADDLVSRKHLKIVATNEQPVRYLVVDLGSRNGTFVNRQRVFGAVVLLPGGRVQLGAGGPEFEFQPNTRSVGRPWRFAGPFKPWIARAAAALLLSGAGGAAGYGAWAKAMPLWREWQNARARRMNEPRFSAAVASASVADVEAEWGVVDKRTGARLARAWIANERASQTETLPLVEAGPASLPVFVIGEDRRIEPLLVPAATAHAGQPVGGKWKSKGVIVSQTGAVLTAAPRRQPWKDNWHWTAQESAGALLVLESQKITQVVPLAASQFPDRSPADSGFVAEQSLDDLAGELRGHHVTRGDLRIDINASINAAGRTWETKFTEQSSGLWLAAAHLEPPLNSIQLPRLSEGEEHPKNNDPVWIVGNGVEAGEIRRADSDGLLALRSHRCTDGGIVFDHEGRVLALCIPEPDSKAGAALAVPARRGLAFIGGATDGIAQ
jgi:hypothetical protein